MVCAQRSSPINNVGRTNPPFYSKLCSCSMLHSERKPRSLLMTRPLLLLTPYPLLLFPPSLPPLQTRGLPDVLWMCQTYCCLRDFAMAVSGLVRKSSAIIQEANFLSPLGLSQMLSPWGLPYLKLQPLPSTPSTICLAVFIVCQMIQLCLLPDFLIRMYILGGQGSLSLFSINVFQAHRTGLGTWRKLRDCL